MNTIPPCLVDPVCLRHGLPLSQHSCLYCTLCFEDLTPEQCNVCADGTRENVCKACAEQEAAVMAGHPVAFLDFDGVWMLWCDQQSTHLPNQARVDRINRILRETHAIPVAVSTRRNEHTEETMAMLLRQAGFANVLDGCTMVGRGNRATAICSFLGEHPYVQHWVVIDDEARHYDDWDIEQRHRAENAPDCHHQPSRYPGKPGQPRHQHPAGAPA